MKLNEVVEPATDDRSRLQLLYQVEQLAHNIFGNNYYDISTGHGVTEGPRMHNGNLYNVLEFILSGKTPNEEIRKFIRTLKQEGYPVHGKYKFFHNDDNNTSTFEVLLDDPEFFN